MEDLRKSKLNQVIDQCDQLTELMKVPLVGFPTGELSGIIDVWKIGITLATDFATKMSLTFKESDDPTDGIPYALKMEQALSTIVQGSRHIAIEIEAGPYLSQLITTRTTNVLLSVKNLSQSLRDFNYNHNNIPKLTKLAWDNCKALDNCPLDEKVAILHAIKDFIPTIKDALNELEQVKTKNENRHREEEEDEDEEDDEDDFDDDDLLTEKEMEVLPGVIQLVKYAAMYAQRIEKIIEMTRNDGNQRQYANWLNEVRLVVQKLGEVVDDLSEGVYSPQNPRDELNVKFQRVKQIILDSLSLLRSNNLCAQQENVSKLLMLIEEKVNASELILVVT